MSISDEELATQMQQRSRSFDAWALEYDRFRPAYPNALFDQIASRLDLGSEPAVADLGAGTGKASLAMASRGWGVTAIEPGDGMMEVLRARAATEGVAIDTRLAAAENTGLPDASVDLVTAAQAFHWFDKGPAVAEMGRICRPGGGAAVFWNARADDRSDFLAAFTAIMDRYIADEHVDRRERGRDRESETKSELAHGGLFAVDERVELYHDVEMGADDFVGYVFTASYVRLFVDEERQRRLRSDLYDLLAVQFGDRPVVVPYDVDLYVGRRTAVV